MRENGANTCNIQNLNKSIFVAIGTEINTVGKSIRGRWFIRSELNVLSTNFP
jgi:hypothetical protein